ncbi:hypothetical protein [Pseudoalteromonas sp. 68 DY56-GL68]|uniref:hypothetical protein n=1 Tax=Pseudoalteromonas sp. 68 DY56-GL68 TaxID=2974919 RepID=UPI00352A2708
MNNKQVFNLRNVYFGAKITTIIRALFVKKGEEQKLKKKGKLRYTWTSSNAKGSQIDAK